MESGDWRRQKGAGSQCLGGERIMVTMEWDAGYGYTMTCGGQAPSPPTWPLNNGAEERGVGVLKGFSAG